MRVRLWLGVQSISMQRQPISRCRLYIDDVQLDVSWWPSRYELCDELM